MDTRSVAVQNERPRINRDTTPGQSIDYVNGRVSQEVADRAEVDGQLDALLGQAFAQIAGKQPLHGFTPVRQTDNAVNISLRWNGANIVARVNDGTPGAFDLVLG
jgi:hypothetical protein